MDVATGVDGADGESQYGDLAVISYAGDESKKCSSIVGNLVDSKAIDKHLKAIKEHFKNEGARICTRNATKKQPRHVDFPTNIYDEMLEQLREAFPDVEIDERDDLIRKELHGRNLFSKEVTSLFPDIDWKSMDFTARTHKVSELWNTSEEANDPKYGKAEIEARKKEKETKKGKGKGKTTAVAKKPIAAKAPAKTSTSKAPAAKTTATATATVKAAKAPAAAKTTTTATKPTVTTAKTIAPKSSPDEIVATFNKAEAKAKSSSAKNEVAVVAPDDELEIYANDNDNYAIELDGKEFVVAEVPKYEGCFEDDQDYSYVVVGVPTKPTKKDPSVYDYIKKLTAAEKKFVASKTSRYPVMDAKIVAKLELVKDEFPYGDFDEWAKFA